MRSLVSILVLLLGFAKLTVAQDPVPDTLDWRGYYPLQIGNAWEWESDLLYFYHAIDRDEIVGDTLLDGQLYFIRQHIQTGTDSGESWVWVDTTYVRYDTTTSSVVEHSGGDSWDYLALGCDLGADFGSVITCPWLAGLSVEVWGGYSNEGACAGVSPDCAPYAAEKYFSWMAGGGHFLHGIGMVPGIPEGAQGGVALTFVRVNGQEYGERAVYLDREEMPRQSTLRLGIYPNPARDQVWVTLPESGMAHSVTVYDVLGRRLLERQVCEQTSCTLKIGDLSPGSYFVQVSAGSRVSGVAPLQIAR